MRKTAILIGASGLLGGLLLDQLLRHPAYERITVLVRKPLGRPLPAKVIEKVVDFDNPASLSPSVLGDDLFYALGTTLRKAGGRAEFRRVELGYAQSIAGIASANGIRQLLLVSAMGVNTFYESLFFYDKVKGDIERAIKAEPFSSLRIFRPSSLIGQRAQARTQERWLESLSFLFVGPYRKFTPIRAAVVAAVMVHQANQPGNGLREYESLQMQAIYDQWAVDQETAGEVVPG
jgi:uncharacterized protein YbjT (DUF2867 family)